MTDTPDTALVEVVENQPDVEHSLKTEDDLYDEYKRLRSHLAVFWMYRPRNKCLQPVYPETVTTLVRRVNFLEDILQIPPDEQFDHEEYDQQELR